MLFGVVVECPANGFAHAVVADVLWCRLGPSSHFDLLDEIVRHLGNDASFLLDNLGALDGAHVVDQVLDEFGKELARHDDVFLLLFVVAGYYGKVVVVHHLAHAALHVLHGFFHRTGVGSQTVEDVLDVLLVGLVFCLGWIGVGERRDEMAQLADFLRFQLDGARKLVDALLHHFDDLVLLADGGALLRHLLLQLLDGGVFVLDDAVLVLNDVVFLLYDAVEVLDDLQVEGFIKGMVGMAVIG